MRLLRRPIFVAAILGTAACSSLDKKTNQFSAYNEGRWEAKALIRDLKNNKSNIVNLDIIAQKPSNFRMEVTTSVGFHLASFLMTRGQVQYVIPKEEKFYYGEISDRSLLPLLNIKLNPKYLFNVVFDSPIEEKDWNCSYINDKQLQSCENLQNKMKVEWFANKDEQKRVRLTSTQFDIQIQFKGFETKVQDWNKAFSLEDPAKYQQIRLR